MNRHDIDGAETALARAGGFGSDGFRPDDFRPSEMSAEFDHAFDGLLTMRPWPLRQWLLPLLGAGTGYVLYRLSQLPVSTGPLYLHRMDIGAFLVVAALCLMLALERVRPWADVAYALLAGVFVALVTNSLGIHDDQSVSTDGWRLVVAISAVAIGLPLYQAWAAVGTSRHEERGDARGRLSGLLGGHLGGWLTRRFGYAEAHRFAWVDLLILCLGGLFASLFLLLAWLIGMMFDLIGVKMVRAIVETQWFLMTANGGGLGLAIGALRGRGPVLAVMLRLEMAVLSLLTPLLAAAMVLFLATTLVTGLTPLWSATKYTTPILLVAIAAALVFINASIGERAHEETRHPLIRAGAMILLFVPLPLAVICAASLSLRFREYGFTPERLWALVFVGVALLYALGYFWAGVRAGFAVRFSPRAWLASSWPGTVRRINLASAFVVAGGFLLLSTPLINFTRIAVSDQVARLVGGRVSIEKFDWLSLRFDLGKPGREAVDALAKSGPTPAIRARAAAVARETIRGDAEAEAAAENRKKALRTHLRVKPAGQNVPEGLMMAINVNQDCDQGNRCLLLYRQGEARAILVSRTDPDICPVCDVTVRRFIRTGSGDWGLQNQDQPSPTAVKALARALEAGDVEVRAITQRQVFVGGEPVGDPF